MGMEFIDIYDSEKKLTGRSKMRKAEKLLPGEYMLVVLTLIERPDHTFLITQRSLDKAWAAGDWETTGGGVKKGESSFEGLCREVKEEVGLDVSGCSNEPVYWYRNDDPEGGDNYFTDIYHCHLDFSEEDVVLQEDEAIGFKFATLEEIKKLGEAGKFLHYKRILEALDAEEKSNR
jgi:8-oxo-dGTP pyrophosphatase MutT (NUDIX family)